MKEVHVHLLINHMPIFGVLFGAIVLALGIWSKSTTTKLSSYVLFFVSALSGLIAYVTGEGAEEAVENIPGIAREMLDQHEEIALYTLVVMIILGAVSILGTFMTVRKPETTNAFAWIILFLSFIVFSIAAKTGYVGGQIRHTEVNGYVIPEPMNQEPREYY
ncbi:MAG TPA: hypothetical protein VK151_04400 [Fluviicola sp.]|nr:hypothetical protein [Fluviicola sp.]